MPIVARAAVQVQVVVDRDGSSVCKRAHDLSVVEDNDAITSTLVRTVLLPGNDQRYLPGDHDTPSGRPSTGGGSAARESDDALQALASLSAGPAGTPSPGAAVRRGSTKTGGVEWIWRC